MWFIGLCFYYYFVRILYLCMYILYICIGLEIFPHILNNKPAFCTLWKCHDRRKLEVGLCHVPIEWLQGFFIVHSTIGRSAHSVPLILNTVLGYMLASCSLCMSIITNHNNCLEVFYDFTVFFLLCIIIFRYFICLFSIGKHIVPLNIKGCTSQSGRCTLSYLKGRYIYTVMTMQCNL